jgi:hypothetical protein
MGAEIIDFAREVRLRKLENEIHFASACGRLARASFALGRITEEAKQNACAGVLMDLCAIALRVTAEIENDEGNNAHA